MNEDKTLLGSDALGAGALHSDTRLGEYRLLRLLGRGAMGEVYEAEQVRLGRHYALKILPLELSQDVSFQRRFESEARLLAQLEHPNLVGIHYAGEAPYRGCYSYPVGRGS